MLYQAYISWKLQPNKVTRMVDLILILNFKFEFEGEELITYLFGCQKEAPQFLIGSLLPRFVQMRSEEMDNLLPCQALFGKKLLSLQSFGLTRVTRTKTITLQIKQP